MEGVIDGSDIEISQTTVAGRGEHIMSTSTLTDDQLKEVNLYYLDEITEFREFVKAYENEKTKAKVYHKLKNFPRISEWIPKDTLELSETEQEMCCGPSHNVSI